MPVLSYITEGEKCCINADTHKVMWANFIKKRSNSGNMSSPTSLP